jgi:hypothetical protein
MPVHKTVLSRDNVVPAAFLCFAGGSASLREARVDQVRVDQVRDKDYP